MVICESYMFEFSVGKDMNQKGEKENFNTSSSISSNIDCQGIENLVLS